MPFFFPGLIISVVIGVGGFFVLTYFPIVDTPAVAFLVASLVSGLAVTILSNKDPSENSDTEKSDEFATLYVGNLPYRVNEQAVKNHFMKVTEVKSVRLLRDRKTGKRKGFGFIEIPVSDSDKVIKKFNDSEFEDRTLKVRIAKDRVREE